jgi:KDO2-lipid IV(A) lauroyltransferase
MPFARRDRRREEEHLKIAFPTMGLESRHKLRRQAETHLGNLLGETAWLMYADSRKVETLCKLTGEEHLRKALEAGKGAVLITAHAGNWEILNARLGIAGIPMSIAVRNVYDPRIDTIATDLRSRFDTEVVHRGSNAGRKLFSALKINRVVGLLIDQDIRDLPGVFVPFFGRQAYTPLGAASLALKADCPVIPAFGWRRPDGTHVAEIHPPLPRPQGDSLDQQVYNLTASATAVIESHIRAHPDQWVWMHRRWKTRPPGEEGEKG